MMETVEDSMKNVATTDVWGITPARLLSDKQLMFLQTAMSA